MTEYLEETPYLAQRYCPGCQPDRDPSREILEATYCETHTPSNEGSEDGSVVAQAYMSGSAEAGGEDNRRWCDFIHGRGREPE